MTIYRNKKNQKLYLLYESKYHYYGQITAEPYNWIGTIIYDAKMKNFQPVGER
jgi:hypothetical protein